MEQTIAGNLATNDGTAGVIDDRSQMPDWLNSAHDDRNGMKRMLKECLTNACDCIEDLFVDESKWTTTKSVMLFLLGALWIKCSHKFSNL